MHGSNRRRSSVATPPPVLALRARPADPQKTVVITGSPRGGTSLAASLVAGLGLPFHGTTENDGRARTSPRYEHPGFVGSWKQDRARYAQTAREMDAQFETWAVKHPRAIDDLAAAASAFRNPHFIFMFKEPLSVALRTSGLGGGDAVRIAKGAAKVLRRHHAALDFCLGSTAPCLLVSYDMALRDPARFIDGAASFLGQCDYDRDAVAARLPADRHLYFDYEVRQRGKRLATGEDGRSDT